MRKFYSLVVRNPKKIIVFFLILTVLGAVLKNLVTVNYNLRDYLPDGSSSTVALEVMEREFDGDIPNARVMVKNVTVPEALEYKQRLKDCEGVESVLWLDDSVNIYAPLETAEKSAVETYYKDNNALFNVTVSGDRVETVNRIRDIIGEEGAMCGDAVTTAVATTGTVTAPLRSRSQLWRGLGLRL